MKLSSRSTGSARAAHHQLPHLRVANTCRQRHHSSSSTPALAAQRPSNTVTVQPQQQHHCATTSSVLCSSLIAAALHWSVLPPQAALAAAAAPVAPGSSPYLEAKKMVYGPTEQGGVRSCISNVNPNCVSTGNTNDSYSPAWFAPAATPAAAADELERAVLASVDGADILQQVTLASGAEYRAFGAPSMFGQDVLEFVIKPEQPSGQLVTYRSQAGSVRYIWPIQQPVGDFDAQRKRLSAIKDNLTGWRSLGCQLIECYQ